MTPPNIVTVNLFINRYNYLKNLPEYVHSVVNQLWLTVQDTSPLHNFSLTFWKDVYCKYNYSVVAPSVHLKQWN